MTKSKFRKRNNYSRIPKGIILPIKSDKKISLNERQFEHEFLLTETERIRYVYTKNDSDKISNIVCVSYDIYILREWVTIIYYDSEHGPLHRHERISFQDKNDVVTEENIKKDGTREDWLTWSIKDIHENNRSYKNLFLKRSNLNVDSLI